MAKIAYTLIGGQDGAIVVRYCDAHELAPSHPMLLVTVVSSLTSLCVRQLVDAAIAPFLLQRSQRDSQLSTCPGK